MNPPISWLLCGTACICAGCTAFPKDALRTSDTLMEDRSMQSREYQTPDERLVLTACAGVLQDLGYLVDEADAELGLLIGTKMRSAVNIQQQVGAGLVLLLTGGVMPTDHDQKFWASVTTHPRDDHRLAVRVTFHRIIWDAQKKVTAREALKEPDIYRDFFHRLSQSIFLEAQQI